MKISIIICTYNRELYLPKCLEHLKNQTEAPSNFEIILVNNNSTDQTENICENFIAQNPQLITKYVKEMNPGLSFARNRGIKESKGDVLVFIDDDAMAEAVHLARAPELDEIQHARETHDYNVITF